MLVNLSQDVIFQKLWYSYQHRQELNQHICFIGPAMLMFRNLLAVSLIFVVLLFVRDADGRAAQPTQVPLPSPTATTVATATPSPTPTPFVEQRLVVVE